MISSLSGVLGFLIIFGAIVFVHEFGHYIVAKLSGMIVPNFSLGFGPPIFKWVRNGTTYAVRAIPLGGYVEIAGMEPSENDETDEGKGLISDYNNKPWFSKFAVIVAGAVMNFIFALLVIIFIGMAIGELQPGKDTYIGGVNPTSPAEKAGLQAGDKIVQINETSNPSGDVIRDTIKNSPKEVSLVVDRLGQRVTVVVSPIEIRYPDRGNSLIYEIKTFHGIGVSLATSSGEFKRMGLIDSVVMGTRNISYIMMESVASIVSLVTGHVSLQDLSGPVGIMRISYGATKNAVSSLMGITSALSLMAFLSVAIGFTNLLPFPALDGGRLVFIIWEGLRGKPVDRNKEAMVHMVGMAILLGLILLITIKDVWMWVGGK